MKEAADRDRPAWRAALMAEEIAPEETSTPVTRGNPARAHASAKPPTPQYRSHRLSGARPSANGCDAHAAACSYRAEATDAFVCAKERGPSSRPSTDSGRVRARVRMISSGPSTMASWVGWMFVVTTCALGTRSRSSGSAARMSETRSRVRSTKRIMRRSPAPTVTRMFLSSPRLVGTS